MIILTIVIIFAALCLLATITNPFSRFTVVRKPLVAAWSSGDIALTDDTDRIHVHNSRWWKLFALFKAGFHIQQTRRFSSPRSQSKTVPAIITDIHKLRYDPTKLLLISGDHFSPLFVRNLGVFYYPMLDRRIASTAEDWYNRQVTYLETTAFALAVFAKSPTLTTTIVSTGRYGVTPFNFYAYPSDTLYGMLYALAALAGHEPARPTEYARGGQKLHTVVAARTLLQQHRRNLKKLYADYRKTVFDAGTGLISPAVHLSGAKDITRRRSAFYDNVIFWKTTKLATELGIIPTDKRFLSQLKKTIIKTFWLPDEGYFLEDLSDEGRAKKYYSSDWLAVLFTGFLDPAKPSERDYFVRSIKYIEAEGIDKPFAIKYQQDRRAHRQFLAVRLMAASYGGYAIWSFWGMECIKTLLILYRATGDKSYRKKADKHIAAYRRNMLRDGGFPEVYDRHGKLLQTPFYRSIRQTGWVIGFEQVLALRATLD